MGFSQENIYTNQDGDSSDGHVSTNNGSGNDDNIPKKKHLANLSQKVNLLPQPESKTTTNQGADDHDNIEVSIGVTVSWQNMDQDRVV